MSKKHKLTIAAVCLTASIIVYVFTTFAQKSYVDYRITTVKDDITEIKQGVQRLEDHFMIKREPTKGR